MSFTLTDNTRLIEAQIRQRAGQLVRKTALKIEQRAKILAPVDTGNLRRSIQSEMQGDLSAIVFAAADYSVHVEFGTRRMTARPFLLPAFEQTEPEFRAELKGLLA